MSGRKAHLDIVRSDAGWFWRFVASNGKELARSSETYKRSGPCIRSAVMMRDQSAEWRQRDERTQP